MMLNHAKRLVSRSRLEGRLIADWTRDAFRALPFVIGLLLVSERDARAYTDPGTGALIWQMVAAGFVGLMFYVRKFTTWFKGKDAKEKDSKD